MKNKLFNKFRQFIDIRHEAIMLSQGKVLCMQQTLIDSEDIHDYEFKIFSQRGEDGIIQYLIKNIDIKNKTFIEFGVENYHESNTRFLMMNNNWRGYIIDGSQKNINAVKNNYWFWQYDLQVKAAFIDKDNINPLMKESKLAVGGGIGLISIDIDGNDYWVMKNMDFAYFNPDILIVEYNALFGEKRAITIPYDRYFYRTKAHYSNLYFGASLKALTIEANIKGYALVGCCTAGTNAFFVRKDLLNDKIKEQSVEQAFQQTLCRQSRNKNHNLNYLRGEEQLQVIQGMDVVNVETGDIEKL